MLFKYHQAKLPENQGKLFSVELDSNGLLGESGNSKIILCLILSLWFCSGMGIILLNFPFYF